MNYTVEKADLFRAEVDVIAHGCNSRGLMGSGIAVAFKRWFPDMYKEYRKKCLAGEFNPGDVFWWWHKQSHLPYAAVANLCTQVEIGRNAKVEYIEASLIRLDELTRDVSSPSVAIPAIGCGIGGLNTKKDLFPLLDSLDVSFDLTVCIP